MNLNRFFCVFEIVLTFTWMLLAWMVNGINRTLKQFVCWTCNVYRMDKEILPKKKNHIQNKIEKSHKHATILNALIYGAWSKNLSSSNSKSSFYLPLIDWSEAMPTEWRCAFFYYLALAVRTHRETQTIC